MAFDSCPGENALSNPKSILTVSLVISLTNNLLKIVICFKTFQCKTEINKNSFCPRTNIDWNHLDDIVRTETADSFRKAVQHWD